MKELSIEEKAKRYNEALEKARQLYVAYPTTKSFISDLQDLFPELKENEDERILEKLISYFSAVKGFSTLECNYGITNEEAANWLKSLKDSHTWKPSKEQIIALRWVLNNIPYNKHKEEISGLLDQIKEL